MKLSKTEFKYITFQFVNVWLMYNAVKEGFKFLKFKSASPWYSGIHKRNIPFT